MSGSIACNTQIHVKQLKLKTIKIRNYAKR